MSFIILLVWLLISSMVSFTIVPTNWAVTSLSSTLKSRLVLMTAICISSKKFDIARDCCHL